MTKKGLFDFKGFFGNIPRKKITNIVLIAAIIGIALIFLSDYFHPSAGGSQSKPQSSSGDISGYEKDTEARLEDLISKINGVGRVKVMVNVDSGVENIYETDNKSTGGADTGGQAQQSSESSHVIVNNASGGQNALLTKQVQPQLIGVVVVCDGGGNPDVEESVTDAVSTALGLASNKISVIKMQKTGR